MLQALIDWESLGAKTVDQAYMLILLFDGHLNVGLQLDLDIKLH